jgi:hypothetical protein
VSRFAVVTAGASGISLGIATMHKGVTNRFGGGPHREAWYRTLDATYAGGLDGLPSIGNVIGHGEVADALDVTRTSDGPPRIVVHPNG